ncbi:MAG: flippase [Candidatus Firestonebacteria bacterium]
MDTFRTISKNTFFVFTSRIITYFLGFVVGIYLARYLDVGVYGKYTFAFSFIAIFNVIADFGLGVVTTREVGKNREKVNIYLGTTLGLRALLGVISFILILIFINILGYPKDTIYIAYIMGIAMVISNLNAGFSAIYDGLEKMEYSSSVNVIYKIISSVYIVILIILKQNVVLIAVSYIITALVGIFIHLYIARYFLSISKFIWDRKFAKCIIKESFPIFLSSFLLIIYSRIDNIFLSKIKGEMAVGLYNVTDSMITALMFIPNSIVTALFPVIGRLYATSFESLKKIYKTAIKYLFLVALPLGVGGAILGSEIIGFLFGAKYLEGSIALKIRVWELFFMYLNDLNGNILVGIGKQKIVFYIIFLSTLINVSLNALLVPHFGIAGSSWASVFTEALPFIIIPLILFKTFGYIDKNIWIKSAISVLIMGGCIYATKHLFLPVTILIGITVYVAFLLIFKVLKREDLAIFKNILPFTSKYAKQ